MIKQEVSVLDMLELVKKQRGMPFLKIGMRVYHHYSNKYGKITDGNRSGNIDVIFEGETYTKNCHPQWEMSYYDDSGELIEEYRG